MNIQQIEDTRRNLAQALNKTGRAADLPIAELLKEAETRLRQNDVKARALLKEAGFDTKDIPDEVSTSNATRVGEKVKEALDLKANGGDIEVSMTRLKKTAARVLGTAESIAPVEEMFFELAENFATQRPGEDISRGVYLKAARAVVALANWEFENAEISTPLEERAYANNAIQAFQRGEPLPLTLFVCPPVDYGMIQNGNPELYLGSSMQSSFLATQVERLSALTKGLRDFGVEFKLNVVIGDTDDQDYLWPVIGKPENLGDDIVAQQRNALAEATRDYIQRKGVVGEEEFQILPLSELKESYRISYAQRYRAIAAIQDNPEIAFTRDDVEQEVQRMQELWRSDGYYQGLPEPGIEDMRAIVARKFAAYAEEGLLLEDLDVTTGSILIQSEKPPLLRNRMLSAGRKLFGQGDWAAVFMNKPEATSTVTVSAVSLMEEQRAAL